MKWAMLSEKGGLMYLWKVLAQVNLQGFVQVNLGWNFLLLASFLYDQSTSSLSLYQMTNV